MTDFWRLILRVLATGAGAVLLCGCLGNSKSAADQTAERLQEAQRSSHAGATGDGKSAQSSTQSAPAGSTGDKGVAPAGGASSGEAGAGQPVAAVSQAGVLPEGWPAELPPYPASRIVLGERHGENGGTVLSVTLATVDPCALVLMFYEEKATAFGFTKQSSATGSGSGGMTFVKADKLFAVTCTEEPSKETQVFLQLKPFSGEAPQQASESYYGQEFPVGFPKEVLPQYPGAKIESASVIESQTYMLVQTTKDPSEKVLAFFRKHYQDLGWKEYSTAELPSGVMLSFSGKTGTVTLVTSLTGQDLLAVSSTYNSKE